MKNKLANIFPLLEEDAHAPTLKEPISLDLVVNRIQWLHECSQASHEAFALGLMQREPADSFHPTLATVLQISNKDSFNQWLALEKALSAKKVTAHRAHLKKIYLRYGIDVYKNPSSDEMPLSTCIKFPHQTTYGKSLYLPDLPWHLASHAFPLARNTERYGDTAISKNICDAAERALERNKSKS